MTRLYPYLRFLRRLFANLPKRAYLTLRYQGVPGDAVPARHLPAAAHAARPAPRPGRPRRGPERARPRLVPHHGSPSRWSSRPTARRSSRSRPPARVKRTTDARVIVADDGSPRPRVDTAAAASQVHRRGRHRRQRRLRRQLQPRPAPACATDEDVVLLNSDVIARRGWLEVLQHAAYGPAARTSASPAPSSCTPTRRSSSPAPSATPARRSGSTTASASSPPTTPPPTCSQPALAVTGACMYITPRDARRESATSTRATAWPTRTSTTACAPGRPGAASSSRPPPSSPTSSPRRAAWTQGKREIDSQQRFWEHVGRLVRQARDARARRRRCASST